MKNKSFIRALPALVLLLIVLLWAAGCAADTPPASEEATAETAVPTDPSAPTDGADTTEPSTGGEASQTPSTGESDIPTATGVQSETADTDTGEEMNFDVFDSMDRSSSKKLIDGSLYSGGLREIEKKDIVLSISSYELQRLLWYNPEGYEARILFTQKESGTAKEHVFPSVTAQMTSSGWNCVDLVLKSESYDCGFCPTAMRNYTVEVAIVRSAAPNKVIYEEKYECRANLRVQLSPYYDPTPDDGPSIMRSFTVSYLAAKNGRIEGETTQQLVTGESAATVKAIPNEGYVFKNWSDGSTDPERTDSGVRESTVFTAYFELIDKIHLADVYLTTEDGVPIHGKDYYYVHMKISGAENPADNLETDIEIKIRGNSSVGSVWDTEKYASKNSYSIKLPEKQKLLGVGDGKSRKWVLNANKFDLSSLRNYFVWDFARSMGTIPFVPQCTWVHLYVDGEYRGLYMLSEKVNVEKGRVEVDDKPTGDPDKGYLIELDFRGQSGDDPWFDIDGYGPEPELKRYDAVEFVIKSDIEGEADIEFIRNYVQNAHYAIMQGVREDIEKYFDLPSLVDMYIIEELSKDCDSGRASFYICKDKGGKIYFTAPWDFDFGFGTYGQATTIPGRVSYDDECCTWFARLITEKWFSDLVRERLKQLEPQLQKALDDLEDMSEKIGDDIDRNAERWNLYGRNYHEYVSHEVSANLRSLEEHISYIVDWVNQRYEWLERN